MALQRVDASNSSGPLQAAQDPGWASSYPMLFEMLVTTRWDDGKPREVATLLLVAEGGVWKGMLNDRANRRTAWLSGATVDELLDAFETGLATASLGWRVTPSSGQGNRRS